MMATGDASNRLGPGALVLVVGPSGVGKDTLINCAKTAFADRRDIVFPKRLITRAADDSAEDHEPIGERDFDRMVAQGDCALAWRAHGLGYLLPSRIDAEILNGHVVVANASRRILPVADDRYRHLVVIHVTAPIDALAERLAARGRETREEIAGRLKRSALSLPSHGEVVEIVNEGPLAASAERMIAALAGIAARIAHREGAYC